VGSFKSLRVGDNLDVAQTDPRAKKVKPQELVDSRYLDEMEKSGFMDQL
jgi:hypothetical protein